MAQFINKFIKKMTPPVKKPSLATADSSLVGPGKPLKMVFGNPKARDMLMRQAEAELDGQTNQAMKRKMKKP